MINQQRDVSFELARSTQYPNMEDEELFPLMNFWYSERMNYKRTPKELAGISTILGRLATEIIHRGKEEALLERQIAGESFSR